MSKRSFLKGTLIGAAIAAGLLVMLFYALPYMYLYSENRNFEQLRKKSELNSETMPLHCLVRDNDTDGIAEYIKNGGNLERTDNWGRTALFWALRERKHPIVNTLLARGANPNARDENGITLFFQAVVSGQFTEADQLLAHGANIDALNGNEYPETTLHYCVMKNKPESVAYLIEHGANKYLKDSFGYTVFDRIKTHEHISPEVAQLLEK